MRIGFEAVVNSLLEVDGLQTVLALMHKTVFLTEGRQMEQNNQRGAFWDWPFSNNRYLIIERKKREKRRYISFLPAVLDHHPDSLTCHLTH